MEREKLGSRSGIVGVTARFFLKRVRQLVRPSFPIVHPNLIRSICFSIVIYALLSNAYLLAIFKYTSWGVRPEGMGGSFSAVANDANSLIYNPAGSVLIESKGELSFSYTKPFTGLGSQVDLGTFYLSYVRSINHHLGFGFGWTNFSSPNLTENSFLLNLSSNLGAILKFKSDLVLGANIKRMDHAFKLDDRTTSDQVFANGSGRDVYSFDFGSWSRPLPTIFPEISLSLVLKNLNRPNVGLKTEDIVPMELISGIAYQKDSYLLSFDYNKRGEVSTYRGGGEIWFFDHKFGTRAGANSSNGSLGFSYNHQFGKRRYWVLDYAFIMPFFVQETAGTHKVSLSLRY